MNSKKILLTGATGFIGSHLAEALVRQKYSVKALVRKTSNTEKLKAAGIELVYGDLRDISSLKCAVRDTDIVYHLAESGFYSRKGYLIDVEATKALIDFSIDAGVKRFVYASTVAVAGRCTEVPCDETRPYDVYRFFFHALAKCEGEKYGFERSGREHFEFTAIRPAAIYGGGSPVIVSIIEWMKNHPHIGMPVIGDGSSTMHFAHIDDIVQAFVLAGIKEEAAGNVYIVVEDNPVPWSKFLQTIANELDITLRIRKIPPSMVLFLSGIIESVSRLIGNPIAIKPGLYFFTDNIHYCNSRAKHDLGFTPGYSDALDGIKNEVNKEII